MPERCEECWCMWCASKEKAVKERFWDCATHRLLHYQARQLHLGARECLPQGDVCFTSSDVRAGRAEKSRKQTRCFVLWITGAPAQCGGLQSDGLHEHLDLDLSALEDLQNCIPLG